MSAELLNRILEDALKILNNSKELREELNLLQTSATFSAGVVSSSILSQLNFIYADKQAKYPAWASLGEADRESIIKYIDLEAEKINAELYKQYKSFENKYPKILVVVNGNTENFTVTVSVNQNDPRDLARIFRGREVDLGPFQVVKEGYRDIIKQAWDLVANKIKELDKRNNNTKDTLQKENLNWQQASADLEHIVGDTVSDRRVGLAMNSIKKKIERSKRRAGTLTAKQVFLELGLEVYIDYLSTNTSSHIDVFLGSSSRNRAQAQMEKDIINSAKKALQVALSESYIKRREELAKDWGGSDSRVTIEKKKIVKNFIKTISKDPKVKISKSIDTEPKLSKRKSKKKKIKKKAKNKSIRVVFTPTIKRKTLPIKTNKTEKSSININALKAQINARLSMTVIKNMGTPALENRTGRFARSVQVTDIVQTSKGFPSIGYTYQKYPYQTFEPGFKQGSAQRDPRTLIDRSIREIASELLVGRFYTRRV